MSIRENQDLNMGSKSSKAKEARRKRVETFKDTQRIISESKRLSASVENSEEEALILEDSSYKQISESREQKDTTFSVTHNRTLEAAAKAHKAYPDKRIAVLNFGSPYRAGGGVTEGAWSQEASLCHCTTLYPVLNSQSFYWKFYRGNNYKPSPKEVERVFYIKDITVFKSDTVTPELLPESEWFNIDVMTMIAPDLSVPKEIPYPNCYVMTSDAELFGILVKRAIHILSTAAYENADYLVLGAIGCGALNNNPQVVAKAFKTAIDNMPKYFEHIEFAVFCKPGDETNFNAFKKEFCAE